MVLERSNRGTLRGKWPAFRQIGRIDFLQLDHEASQPATSVLYAELSI
jgi:hypothetical protein